MTCGNRLYNKQYSIVIMLINAAEAGRNLEWVVAHQGAAYGTVMDLCGS